VSFAHAVLVGLLFGAGVGLAIAAKERTK